MSSASNLAKQLSQDQTLSTILSNVSRIKFTDHTVLYLDNGNPIYYTVGYNSHDQHNNEEEMLQIILPPPVRTTDEINTKLDDTKFQDRETPEDYIVPHPTPTTPKTPIISTPTTPIFQGNRLGGPVTHRSRFEICRDLSRRYSSF